MTPLPSGAAGAIIVRLALQPRVRTPAAQLVELVWGDEPPATARHAVAVYLSAIRARLGRHPFLAKALDGNRAGYLLDVDEDDVDALVLLRAANRAAAADAVQPKETLQLLQRLWELPAFGGLAERFRGLEASAQALHRAHASLVLATARSLLDEGDTSGALPLLLSLHQDTPTNEEATLLLMRTLALAGRRHEALDVYRTGARALRQAGLATSEALRRAQKALAAEEPLLMPRSPVTHSSSPDLEQRLANTIALATHYATRTRLPVARDLNELRASHGELTYALGLCEKEKRWETLLSLAVSLRVHWWVGGYLVPGLRWLLLGLRHARSATDDQHHRAHYYVGHLAKATGSLIIARTSAARAAQLARSTDDRLAEAWTLLLQAGIDRIDGDSARCLTRLAEAREQFADRDDSPGLAAAHGELARLYSQSGERSAAISAATVAVTIARTTGQSRVTSDAELTQAIVYEQADLKEDAKAAASRAAEDAIACGDRLLLPRALLVLASTHEDPIETDRLRGAATAIITSTGARSPDDLVPTLATNEDAWHAGWMAAMAHPHGPMLTTTQP